MRLCVGRFALCAGLAFAASSAWAKVGLTTTVPEADLGELKPGETCSLAERHGRPYIVVNRGDAPLTVAFEARPARTKGTRAEPAADPAWVSFSTATVTLQPGEAREVGVRVRVPARRAFQGLSFAVVVTARSVGDSVSVAVDTLLRFKVKGGGRK